MRERRKTTGQLKSSDGGIQLAKTLSENRKILVVDDDAGVRDVLRIIFVSADYDVELMEDGRRIFTSNFKPPDLFIIDKLLPGVNGLDLCKHLKAKKETSHIPVIMISASPGIGAQASEAGADDYIEKPFEKKHLLEVIERNLRRQAAQNSTN